MIGETDICVFEIMFINIIMYISILGVHVETVFVPDYQTNILTNYGRLFGQFFKKNTMSSCQNHNIGILLLKGRNLQKNQLIKSRASVYFLSNVLTMLSERLKRTVVVLCIFFDIFDGTGRRLIGCRSLGSQIP